MLLDPLIIIFRADQVKGTRTITGQWTRKIATGQQKLHQLLKHYDPVILYKIRTVLQSEKLGNTFK